jgi:hypothetical protein
VKFAWGGVAGGNDSAAVWLTELWTGRQVMPTHVVQGVDGSYGVLTYTFPALALGSRDDQLQGLGRAP